MDKLEEIKVQLIDLKDGSATIDESAERILSLFSVRRCVCCGSTTSSKNNYYCDGCLAEEDYR